MKLTEEQLRSVVRSVINERRGSKSAEELSSMIDRANEALMWLQDNTTPYRGVSEDHVYRMIELVEDTLNDLDYYLRHPPKEGLPPEKVKPLRRKKL